MGFKTADNKQPLISLIIPVYNVRNYLRECLDSVKVQAYRNLSVIIVDDGSTDGCGAICDEYSATDDRFTVFHTANRGLSAARNHGLDNIDNSTEYIAFLDGDDWMEPNAIQKIYDAANRADADLAVCTYFAEYIGKRTCSGSPDREIELNGRQVLTSFIRDGYMGNVAWNKLYRADLFSDIRYPEGRIYEDIATTYKIIPMVQKAVIIPDKLVHYRTRRKSLSRTHTKKAISDHWESHKERYLALKSLTDAPDLLRCLNGDCLLTIGHAWRWYYDCPKEDRKGLDPVMTEMQDFVREYCSGVITDKRYTLHQRAACLWSKSRNPLLLRALYYSTLMYKALSNKRAYE